MMKMKNILTLITLACVLGISFVLGATETMTFAKDDPANSLFHENKDRLIGVFVTTDYLDLFDMESFFQDNADKILSGSEINPSGSAPYQGKLYGTLVDNPYTDSDTGESIPHKKYIFDGINGISYFTARYTDENGMEYWSSSDDSAISDANTAYHTADAGDSSIDLKGTIYVSTSVNSTVFYFNPIYQTATGEVYVLPGQGTDFRGEISPGIFGSHTVEADYTLNP